MVLLGQSVLLRGVNDSAEALEALLRAMLRARVTPYYLHALDPRRGASSRYQMPRGALVEGLRGKVPGFAVPVFVRERENGGGKKPVRRVALTTARPVGFGQMAGPGQRVSVSDKWRGGGRNAGFGQIPCVRRREAWTRTDAQLERAAGRDQIRTFFPQSQELSLKGKKL